MKRSTISFLLIIAMGAAFASIAQEKESDKVASLKVAGNQVETMLANEDFAGVWDRFSSGMKKAVPQAELQATWQSVTSQAGVLEKVLSTEVKEGTKNDLVILKCKFAKVDLFLHVAFNKENQISNLDILDK